jgi:hypothetical protein
VVPERGHSWLSALPADLLGDLPLGCAGAGELEKPGTAWDGSQWKGTAKSANGLGRVSIEETAREPGSWPEARLGHVWGINRGTTGDNNGSPGQS